MRVKRAIHILIIMSLLICTGCWDKKEIEQWGYVLGIAVDPPTLGKGAGGKEGEDVYKRQLLYCPCWGIMCSERPTIT